MGTVGDFTVSSMTEMDEDKKEKGTVDMVKLTADIAAQLEVAKAVSANGAGAVELMWLVYLKCA